MKPLEATVIVQGRSGRGTGWRGSTRDAEGVVHGKERAQSSLGLGGTFKLTESSFY